MLFKSPRGTKDILPPETCLWQSIEEQARQIFPLYAYEEVRTPVIEEAGLFLRSLGDLSDIVQKQMFVIKKETDAFVLRPEATAAIIRSYIEHGLYQEAGLVKWFYIGPMFRAERPQKGRLRQFHHIGCEAIGSYSPYIDAETIRLACHVLDSCGVKGYEIFVNSLGCSDDKKRLAIFLKEKLSPHKRSFCQDCQARIDRNVFRVLDCKNPQCREYVSSLNIGTAHMCQDCRQHFDEVLKGLSALGVACKTDHLLVRGLDYYTRTVFEIKHQGLGSQDAIGAGGRYDNLVEDLGGPKRGAVGFALGMERLLLARQGQEKCERELDCYFIALGEAAEARGLGLVNVLRQEGISAEMDLTRGSLKSSLRRADASKARVCLIFGDNEISKGVVIVKDMSSGTQEEAAVETLAGRIKEILQK